MPIRRRVSFWLLLGFALLIMACLPIPFLSQNPTVEVITSTPVPATPTERVVVVTATAAPTTPASSDIIADAVMAMDAQGAEKNPVNVTSSFPADQGIFHAVITISNAPNGTRFKVEWMVVDDGNASDANTKMAEFELAADGSRNLDFTFKPNAGRLPAGTYKADLYLNGNFNRSLNFSVAQGGASPSPSTVITKAVVAPDVQGSNFEPVGATDTFPSTQSSFHAVITIADAPKGTRIKVEWTVVDDGNPSDANSKMGEYELTSEGSRNLDFTFKPNAGQLPVGKYKADIYLNGEANQSLVFSVSGSQ
jgi:hypothetical protein